MIPTIPEILNTVLSGATLIALIIAAWRLGNSFGKIQTSMENAGKSIDGLRDDVRENRGRIDTLMLTGMGMYRTFPNDYPHTVRKWEGD